MTFTPDYKRLQDTISPAITHTDWEHSGRTLNFKYTHFITVGSSHYCVIASWVPKQYGWKAHLVTCSKQGTLSIETDQWHAIPVPRQANTAAQLVLQHVERQVTNYLIAKHNKQRHPEQAQRVEGSPRSTQESPRTTTNFEKGITNYQNQ